MQILEFLQALLLEPVIVIGLLVFIGYLLSKSGAVKTITGTVSAMVGLLLILFGGSMFSNTFKPIVEAVSSHYGITGYLMDPYAMRSATQELLGDRFGFVGYVFIIGKL
ncbi:hypothetical protein CYJ29_04275 [Aerococcus loyolae]|uniref:PTS transporter subunit IIC n=1 Tax=Aerococcus loyolae TaxID=2976809 RepID=UPI000C766C13|nr:PTS transporter subunit IIC [Aerococcus loyolae]PKY85808.1 hypothetical protein CYJ30_03995 [Aerococcus loyolae]PKZ03707.1 hypothetical protein CYJ29_04275 [Aerococcus loyolae]